MLLYYLLRSCGHRCEWARLPARSGGDARETLKCRPYDNRVRAPGLLSPARVAPQIVSAGPLAQRGISFQESIRRPDREPLAVRRKCRRPMLLGPPEWCLASSAFRARSHIRLRLTVAVAVQTRSSVPSGEIARPKLQRAQSRSRPAAAWRPRIAWGRGPGRRPVAAPRAKGDRREKRPSP